jgi:hypothetical protein
MLKCAVIFMVLAAPGVGVERKVTKQSWPRN